MAEITKQMQLAVEQTAKIANLMDDSFLILDEDHVITMANDMAVRVFGDNLINTDAAALFDASIFNNAFDEVRTTKTQVEFVTSFKSDPLRQYRIRMQHLNNAMIGMLMLDMTAQHNLEKLRRDFVANVSHELRSPLTSLIGFIETMETVDHLDDKIQKKFLGIMSEESRRMSRLIDDLLSLSRVEVEEHVAPTEFLFVDHVVKSVIASFHSRAIQKNMAVRFINKTENLDEGVMVLGETDEIMEVFHNLIDNALKYGRADTVVRVEMSNPDKNNINFDVINEGEGIEEIHLSRLTERFYRADKHRSRQVGGTGLGLAIVKHIIGRHRGKINITSVMNGETNFQITLPRHTAMS